MVVAYDHKRGEGRAKFRKNEDRAAEKKGDCIDCSQCVQVCPTGIDIRHGTQLECVNCTACIDACDHMMDSVGMDKGLIRFVSENGIKNGTRFQWTRRVKAYTTLLIGMIVVLVVLLVTRKDFETTILRQRGSTYQILDGSVSNIFEINLTNKTRNDYTIELKTEDPDAEIEMVVSNLTLEKEEEVTERFIMKIPLNTIKNGRKNVTVIIMGNGKELQREEAQFIGPVL